MKKLYISRHAKADWPTEKLSDFERPLNERGRNDTLRISRILRDNHHIPNIILSSPAIRAATTARCIAELPGYIKIPLIIVESLYMTNVKHTLEVLSAIDDALQSVMIVGHNPVQTLLLNYLTDEMIDSMPTGGLAIVNFEHATSWQEISRSTGILTNFYRPREIIQQQ